TLAASPWAARCRPPPCFRAGGGRRIRRGAVQRVNGHGRGWHRRAARPLRPARLRAARRHAVADRRLRPAGRGDGDGGPRL
ncbi:MAG: hypothetical protein AVDCRST_MAG04-210, partial [uncultured Acetobacteraceae bacterium]